MQLPIYIFSAKQGMQWLSGTSSDVVRLDTIRKRIGKLVDFDAGETPYRGILADNEVCYVYACFLAPRFDFRGRDATYFIFTEVPKAAWNTFNFDALKAFTFVRFDYACDRLLHSVSIKWENSMK